MNQKLKVLFISGELIAGDLAYRLKNEGCDVKLYIEDKYSKDCFDGMVDKTDNWRKELKWVGKDGLIVFDDVGYGKIQDDLRKQGYNVFGGCEEGDRLELDREYAQKIFASCGMNVEPVKNFKSIESAIKYIKKHKSRWVIKQNGHESVFAYVGKLDDGRDVISLLENYKKYKRNKAIKTISLQRYIDGVEVAVARYFNGSDWTSPIFISFEHKPFMNDNVGPLTAEMGTIGWHDNNENNKLFLEALAKLKPYLQKINYKGHVDINSIFTRKGVVPLEATMRFGCPENQLQSEAQISLWKDLLLKTSKGEKYNLKYKKQYSIVVTIGTYPFPYKLKSLNNDFNMKGIEILFKDKLTRDELNRIHFEEISIKKIKNKTRYFISGNLGYNLYITASGNTMQKARAEVYKLIDKIIIPKMIYRTDIGIKFMEKDEKLLKKWKWI